MSKSDFDPYLKWLGLDVTSAPVDHYRLLGLSPAEKDRERIRQVAIARLQLVRKQDPGEHRDEWETLIRRLQIAGRCLIDDERRAEYDRKLAAQDNLAPDRLASQTEIPMAIPIATPVSSEVVSKEAASSEAVSPQSVSPEAKPSEFQVKSYTPSVTSKQRHLRSRNKRFALVTVFALSFIVSLVWMLREPLQDVLAGLSEPEQKQSDRKKPNRDAATKNAKRKKPSNRSDESETRADPIPTPPQNASDRETDSSGTRNDETTSTKSESTDEPNANGHPKAPSMDKHENSPAPSTLPDAPSTSPTSTPPPTEAPEETELIKQKLSDAFQAMRERDQQAAERLLNECAKLASIEKSKQQVESMETLHGLLAEFWIAVETSMNGMKSGHEIVVGSTRAMVVDSNREKIKIRFLGQSREYARADLPSGLAITLAEERLATESGHTQLILGAFRLVDREGNIEAARDLWSEAATRGEEVESVLPLLEYAEERAGKGATDSPPEDATSEATGRSKA